MRCSLARLAAAAALVASVSPAWAADEMSKRFGWFSGDWQLTIGASGAYVPEYLGDNDYEFRVTPLFSLGKAGPEARFVSRNDNISLSLIDSGAFRAGPNAKLIFGRDADDSPDLRGLDEIDFGVELGGFAEFYPTDWLRLRGEVRQGISSHKGVVADLSADAFYDVNEAIRVSGGPRARLATSKYFDAYFGVTPAESAASGLTVYDPKGGFESVGAGGAITWRTTDRITTSLFGEYDRLVGPAADSSLVRARGSDNQFEVGVSATYRFDFFIP
jgi:outer membrane scaffolding protein for murein synthesis (MipA/OmpV family)